MKRFLSLILSGALALSCAISVSADGLLDESDVVLDDDPSVSDELGEIAEGLPDVSGAFTPQEPDEAATEAPEREPSPPSEPSAAVLNSEIMPLDVTYGGAWSGSILEYFSGVMCSHPFKDYVCFRRDQYTYVLYYGTNIELVDNSFQGNDLNLITYTTANGYNNNEYVSSSSGQSLYYNIDGIFYSNVGDSSQFKEVREIEWLIIACVALCVIVAVSLIRGIFKS